MNAIHYFSSSDMAWMIRRTLPLVCLLATLVSPQVVRAGAQAVQTGAQAVSPDSLQTTPLPAPVTPPQRQGVRIVLHTESAAPVCLAMDAHGALYVADEKAGTIRCVTRDGESGLLVSGLHAPCAIAVSHHRELVVGTRLGEIWKIMPDGSAELAGKMDEPVVSVTMDRDGAVLAATERGTVLRIPAAQ